MRLNAWLLRDANAGGGSGAGAAGSDGVAGGSGNGDGTGNNAGNGSGGDEKVTMTRAEFEAQFGARAKRASETALKTLFETMGVKDADSLKAIIADHKKASEAQKSEADKMRDAMTAAEAARDKAIADAKAAADAATAERIAFSIESAASRLGFAHPEDAAGHPALKRDAIKVGEDGKVAGVEEALKSLAKARPELIAATRPGDDNTRRRQSTNSNTEQDTAEFASNWGVNPAFVQK